MSNIIEVENLGINFNISRKKGSFKSYLKDIFNQKQKQKFWALRNVSFSVERGEILGVIGANGSGKSTLLKTIGGIYRPDEGTIKVNGTPSALLSLGTGFRPQLSGYENVLLNGVMLGFERSEILAQLDNILEFSELNDFIHQPVKNYSSGMKARLGFSIAAYLNREIMLIDEVLGVGDRQFKKKSQDKMKELIHDKSKTVVIVSHSLSSIKEYATKTLWINKSKFMMLGEPEEVISEYEKF